ncbi:MAG: hypothetical protein AB7H66_16400 [Hyphomonadaceae bacterium]
MLRNAIGVAVGAAVGAAIFWFGSQFYQQYVIAPSGADATRPHDYADFLASNPVAALTGAPLVWSAAALAGGAAAVLIAKRSWVGWIIGAIALLCVIANMMLIPLPWWAWVAGVAGVALGAFISTRLTPAT